MVGEVHESTRAESGATQQFLGTCGDRLQHLLQQIEDQLHKTKGFVSLQLGYIEADQQREIMHNQIELSQVQIAESRKAIQQTETVRKLTILAFVFIPTSIICSFFGMNIKELDNHPRIWVFFTALILVITLVLIIAAADSLLTFLMRIFAAIPVIPRYGCGEPQMSQTRQWIAFILMKVVHTPFALVWKVSLILSQKFKKFMSEGHEYRTGYQDPDRFTQGRPTLPYTDRGVMVADQSEGILFSYRLRWREFWHKAGPNDPPMAPIPPPRS
jgi:CorA-like Mg2+ transporter protein